MTNDCKNRRKELEDLFYSICPDCGCSVDKPEYNRTIVFSDGKRIMSTVYIECPNCGFRTGDYSTVRACYEEWNKCEL